MKWFGKTGRRITQNPFEMEFSTEEKKQYDRHLILEGIGVQGQKKLKESSVLVIGAGGLGCPLLQYLTAAGVGTIGIVDDDTVDQSNLQRQILFRKEDVGKNKAEVAASRLKNLNPYINFKVFPLRLSNDNVLDLIQKFDVLVDGTDNFSSRYLISDAAVLANKPVVFGSIFKFQGQVSLFNYQGGPTYRCLFPNPPKPEEVPNCSEIGVLGVLPGIIGSFQANEVLKLILGLGDLLSGKLLTYDALELKQMIFAFEKNENILIDGLLDDYDFFCGVKQDHLEISYADYKEQQENFHVLDVRTAEERSNYSIPSLHIPLSELEHRIQELPADKKLLVYCKSGMRSAKAIEKLRARSFPAELFNLKGGLPFGGL